MSQEHTQHIRYIHVLQGTCDKEVSIKLALKLRDLLLYLMFFVRKLGSLKQHTIFVD